MIFQVVSVEDVVVGVRTEFPRESICLVAIGGEFRRKPFVIVAKNFFNTVGHVLGYHIVRFTYEV